MTIYYSKNSSNKTDVKKIIRQIEYSGWFPAVQLGILVFSILAIYVLCTGALFVNGVFIP